MPDPEPPNAAPLEDRRFGAIAVWGGMASQEAVDAVAAEQAERRRRGEEAPRIGELMAARGLLTEEQVRRILRVQLQRLPDEGHLVFGQIAGVSRLVGREDVERALDEQSRDILAGGAVRRIGEILLERGTIDRQAADAILAFQASADGLPLTEARSARAARQAHLPGPAAPVETETPAAPADPVERSTGRRSSAPARPAFLPKGRPAFLADNVIWLVLALAAACALALIFLTDTLFG